MLDRGGYTVHWAADPSPAQIMESLISMLTADQALLQAVFAIMGTVADVSTLLLSGPPMLPQPVIIPCHPL